MKMQRFTGLVMVLLTAINLQQVKAHGYLYEPPARGTMWRKGFSGVPKNYNDRELYCGGFAYQVSQGGKCGFCGDPYPGPYAHEVGGKYFTDVIGQTYTQGQMIVAEVVMTATHMGWFEFRLCKPPGSHSGLTSSCTDYNTHLLRRSNGQTRTNGIDRTGLYKVDLLLPQHVVCDFCVLQWRYHTGNSWGTDPNGMSCVGCGAQEEFYGCANIAITSGTGGGITPSPTPRPPQPTPAPTPGPTPGPTPAPSSCRAIVSVPGMNSWCIVNCAMGYCPATHCTCN